MHPLSEQQRKAVQAVLAQALVYVRSCSSVAASKGGLDADTCRQLNNLLNIVHNIPGMVEGTYALGFDEGWFTRALCAFDDRNGTFFAKTYEEQAGASSDHELRRGRHFAELAELAETLDALPAEIVEHQYSATDFGSWSTSIRCHGKRFRLVFDGRENEYRLEHSSSSESGATWRSLWAERNPSKQRVRDAITEALRAAK